MVLSKLPGRFTRKQLGELGFWDYPDTVASNLAYPYVPSCSGYLEPNC